MIRFDCRTQDYGNLLRLRISVGSSISMNPFEIDFTIPLHSLDEFDKGLANLLATFRNARGMATIGRHSLPPADGSKADAPTAAELCDVPFRDALRLQVPDNLYWVGTGVTFELLVQDLETAEAIAVELREGSYVDKARRDFYHHKRMAGEALLRTGAQGPTATAYYVFERRQREFNRRAIDGKAPDSDGKVVDAEWQPGDKGQMMQRWVGVDFGEGDFTSQLTVEDMMASQLTVKDLNTAADIARQHGVPQTAGHVILKANRLGMTTAEALRRARRWVDAMAKIPLPDFFRERLNYHFDVPTSGTEMLKRQSDAKMPLGKFIPPFLVEGEEQHKELMRHVKEMEALAERECGVPSKKPVPGSYADVYDLQMQAARFRSAAIERFSSQFIAKDPEAGSEAACRAADDKAEAERQRLAAVVEDIAAMRRELRSGHALYDDPFAHVED